ncbi:MAG: hypothetical protein HKP61_22355 [Dactylosporangium sp.]|nr:hypothetical protein [Dactylosporangium sp.]NNJ63619.1 hypothetical protein [Dactylosporangium sp.]
MSPAEQMYLDVGVSGIQRYLARTPDLKGRRGASAWLTGATDRDGLRAWIREQRALADQAISVNDEAGEADGLIPLRMPAGVEPRPVVDLVVSMLRRRLPGLQIAATWGLGNSYLDAHRRWRSTHQDPALASLPPIGDFPPLESCGLCRADPAVAEITVHDREYRICADCRQRYVDRYRRPGLESDAVPVGAECWLLEGLGLGSDHAVQEFDALANLGEAGGNRNHLATVSIDGNAIGALFRRILDGADPAAKQHASRAVAEATRQALLTATRAVLPEAGGSGSVPVIPHVLGGDDLLVSVVADRAWRFATAYLSAFERHLRESADLQVARDGGDGPTASAGVVFARATFPFRRAVELSESLLRQAKRAHAGRIPAVAWLDVTQEGEHPPPHRSAWTLDELTGMSEALAALRTGVPPSNRAVLERLADPADPGLAQARLRDHVRRLGHAAVLDPFLDMDPTTGRLLDALSLVRWWR